MVFAGINLVTYGAQWLAFRHFAGTAHIATATWVAIQLWSRGLLLKPHCLGCWDASGKRSKSRTSGSLRFPSVGAFSIAMGLLALLQGAQASVLNVFLPAGAALSGKGDRTRLGRLLLVTTRWNILALGGGVAVYGLFGSFFLDRYVGSNYAIPAQMLLNVLLLGHVTRLSMAPFAVLAIAAGDHRRVILSPLAEGVTNLGVAILLGRHFGAIGVAWGTFVGSLVGVGLHLFMNIPRSSGLGVSLDTFSRQGFVPAFLIVSPWLVLLAHGGTGHSASPSWLWLSITFGASIAGGCALFLRWRRSDRMAPMN